MADEQRPNASGADGWEPDERSDQSAYEGRQRPGDDESLSGTRVGRGAAAPTGHGGNDAQRRGDTASTQEELDEETRREGGGAPRERSARKA